MVADTYLPQSPFVTANGKPLPGKCTSKCLTGQLKASKPKWCTEKSEQNPSTGNGKRSSQHITAVAAAAAAAAAAHNFSCVPSATKHGTTCNRTAIDGTDGEHPHEHCQGTSCFQSWYASLPH